MNFFQKIWLHPAEEEKLRVSHETWENTGRCNELFVKECAGSVKA
jgi:hypothetical protein